MISLFNGKNLHLKAFIWLVVLFRQNLATICKDGPGQRKMFISESILNFSLRALKLDPLDQTTQNGNIV